MKITQDLLLAYMFRTEPPSDLVRFRRLARINGQLGAMTAVSFLLYRPQSEAEISVRRFLFQIVPRLLPHLTRTQLSQRVVLRDRTGGRIDWSSTYKVRYSSDANPTLFVCQQSRRRFDQPENQLLKFILHHINILIEQISLSLRNWFAWGISMRDEADKPLHIGDELATLAHRLRITNSSVYLQEITLPATIETFHIQAARTTRNKVYNLVADLYNLYDAVVKASKWDKWAEVLNRTMPLPPNANEVGQLLMLS